MPQCDMVSFGVPCREPASHDARLIGMTTWAYLCPEHYAALGSKSHFTVLPKSS